MESISSDDDPIQAAQEPISPTDDSDRPPDDANSPGALVRVAGSGPVLDGIVFDRPSSLKVVVAVMDPARGPRFRTVNPSSLSERAQEGRYDRALRLLIRRTPLPNQGGARGETRGEQGRSGFKRGAMHRTTGR
jgi:hypothetical protein